jgi:glyoxylase-like metal-dependent hydrolase (beta-lactamase superfamily II)
MKQIDDHWAYQPGEHFRYNAGLVASQGKAFLIDPGMTRNEIRDIQAFLANSGLKCEGIILTHFHWDHIMGANDFEHVEFLPIRSSPVS